MSNITRNKTSKALWLLIAVVLLVVGCGQQAGDSDPSAPLDEDIYNDPDLTDISPRLRVQLTDKPVDNVDNVWLTISEVAAHHDERGWITISNQTQTLDLLGLRYGVASTLGITSIPAGSYSELRLLVTDSSIVVEGDTYDLFVPSGSSSGVKIKFHFEADDETVSTMLLDWDASSSVHYAPGEGYILHPVIHIRSYRTEELDSTPPSTPVVDSPSHPDSDAWSPENTAEFHWTATDDIGVDGFSFSFDQVPSTVPDEVADHTVEDEAAAECQPSTYADAPTCATVEPTVVLQGGMATVYGTNFGQWTSTITVTLNDEPASIISVQPTQIVLEAPMTLGSYEVKIFNPKGEATCERSLEVVGDTAFCPDGEFEIGKGLLGKVYDLGCYDWGCRMPDFDTMGEPQSTITACQLNVPTHRFEEGFPGVDDTLLEWFTIRFTAGLDVPRSGTYRFKMNSDDGSILWIDGNKVIDNDGVHAPVVKTGSVYLEAGLHDFVVEYFQGPRVLIALQVWWTPPGGSEEIIPKDRFLLPSNPAAGATSAPVCSCSGHGAGAYNYRAYGVNDGDGTMFYMDLYDDEPQVTELGRVRSPNNRTLEDLESLAILNGQFYGINNTGHSTIANRLYRIDPTNKSGINIRAEEVGRLKDNGSTVQDLDCLATSPDGLLYAISTATNRLYTIDTETAQLTRVMNVTGNIEGCAFGPSGTLYGLDNSGSYSKLVRIDIDGETIEDIAELPYNTDVESLGWHPDGFLYAGIDNTSNDYPPIAKIRPTDGVVVETITPDIELPDVEGLEFDYTQEETTCACDMDLESDVTATASGAFRITDENSDGFSETVTFQGDQMLSGVAPESDALHAYSGIDFACFLPKSRVLLNSVELNPASYTGNRFAFVETTVTSGFALQLLQDDCSYQTVAEGSLKTANEYIFAQGNHGSFWLKLDDVTVTNDIDSSMLAALEAQDEPAVLMFNIQIEPGPQHLGSIQHKIKSGMLVEGLYSFTLQAGRDVIGSEDPDLPACPDPSEHVTSKEGSAVYEDVADGIWYFHVRTVDDSGNWGETAHYMVKIDASAPEAPVVSSPTHVSQDMEYQNNDPRFVWTMSDLSGIAGYSYTVDTEPATMPNEQIDSTVSEMDYTDMQPGEYYFHVRGQNNAGLWSEPTHFHFVIADADAPEPTIPPGYSFEARAVYQMGCPDGKQCYTDEKQHYVEVGPILIMQYETTNRQYRECVTKYNQTPQHCEIDTDCPNMHYCNDNNYCATGCEHQPTQEADYWRAGRDTHPVTYVDWSDAKKYCISQGLRLPTEAEWEVAAKPRGEGRYPWGDTYEETAANGMDMGQNTTMKVGQFNGKNPGYEDGSTCNGTRCIFDMAGNVEEWVADNYHTYPDAPDEDSAVSHPYVDGEEECRMGCHGDTACLANCSNKVTRGGSFLSDARQLRIFQREKRPALLKSDNIGFRCVMDWVEPTMVTEVCDGVDNTGDGEVDEGFDDTDQDGVADCVDDDDDNDDVLDEDDNCPLAANSDQADPDLDGHGEACDPDGENLEVTYAGLSRPWDVVVDNDGSIYVAGSKDGSTILSSDQSKTGAVLSINDLHRRTGQVQLADDTSANTQYEDFRPNKVSLSPQGYLYVTDTGSSSDDGIWKIVRNSRTNQLGQSQSPDFRNGDAGSTQRFFMGDNTQRGIDRTSGNVVDNNGGWIYVTRSNAKQVVRFALETNGAVSDEQGQNGELIAQFNSSLTAPAIDAQGNLYYIRKNRLYRQRMIDGELQSPEQLSDGNSFRNVSAMKFNATGNLYILHQKGTSNKWPFVGSYSDRQVPAKSGYISKVPAAVLAHATSSNIIRHGDETKQMLVYGGPASREILFGSKRLNGPRGFAFDSAGNFVIANTDDDEVVVLSPATSRLVATIATDGEFEGLE